VHSASPTRSLGQYRHRSHAQKTEAADVCHPRRSRRRCNDQWSSFSREQGAPRAGELLHPPRTSAAAGPPETMGLPHIAGKSGLLDRRERDDDGAFLLNMVLCRNPLLGVLFRELRLRGPTGTVVKDLACVVISSFSICPVAACSCIG
jgi:hypothetical protein